MSKGFTPLIGLAVVVALALAAVFGALSIANPAMAAIGQPADAALSERTFSPQATPVTVYAGGSENIPSSTDTVGLKREKDLEITKDVNLLTLLGDNGSKFSSVGTPVPLQPGTATATASSAFNTVGATVRGVAEGETTIRIPVTLDEDGDSTTTNDVSTVTIELAVTVKAPEGAKAKGSVPSQKVEQGKRSVSTDTPPRVSYAAGTANEFMISDYFEAGKGLGANITSYTVTVYDSTGTSTSDHITAVAGSGVNLGKLTLTPVAIGASETDPSRAGNTYIVQVVAGDTIDPGTEPVQRFFVDMVAAGAVTPTTTKPTVELAGSDPGENTKYTVTFKAASAITTGVDEITVEFKDFSVPATVEASSVTVSVTGMYNGDGTTCDTVDTETGGCREDRTFTNDAAAVSVDGEKLVIDLKVKSDDFVDIIAKDKTVKVVVGQSAGVSNPTEAKTYKEVEVNGVAADPITIVHKLSLSEDDGGRNAPITATGKGFKNGTTMTVVRLNSAALDAAARASAKVLCSTMVGDDDVGKCEFNATSPLFTGGATNYINATDGKGNFVAESKVFELKPSIAVNPASAGLGESLLIQLYDFTPGASVSEVMIAGQTLWKKTGMPNMLARTMPDGYSKWTPSTSTSSTGEANFRLVIPNGSPQGVQVLTVKTDSDEDDTANVVITGPTVTSTPSTVLANQRISLVGNGFTSDKEITEITFAGEMIPSTRINNGAAVMVDNGGNWSASVDLPLTNSTTSAGMHKIQVTDEENRVGQVEVTVPGREVMVTPKTGRVGTIAVVSGSGFPSKNDEGNSFNIEVVYESGNNKSVTVSAVPDASGRFEVQLRIPTTASIPSTNTVKVSFRDNNEQVVVTNVTHDVPEGIITLSETSGGPGTTISVSGEGFKTYVPVRRVMIGNIDISPAPLPSTDANGMVTFAVLIPGLDVGIQTIEVKVGDTTASTGFTVIESGIAPGDIKPVAEAIEPVGDNLVSVWHFNNDTKVWAFYSPALEEGNTLTLMITGETYLIQVSSTQEVILNRDTRSLTCVGDNCWNQIVW